MEDKRLVFRPRDRISITKGEYAGQTGTVDALVGMVKSDDQWEPLPGYNPQMDSGEWLTVRWSFVEAK